MHRHQWIIFLSNFILYRDFTSRYISYRIVYSILDGAGYICIYIYICIYVYICIYAYIFMCICICMYMPANACYCVYMIICMSFMCAHFMYADFMMFFYLWLLGQRWPNKEVQTYVNPIFSSYTLYILIALWYNSIINIRIILGNC